MSWWFVPGRWAFLGGQLETRQLVLSEKRCNTAARFQEFGGGAGWSRSGRGGYKPYGPVSWISVVSAVCCTVLPSPAGGLRELGEVFGHGGSPQGTDHPDRPSGGRIGLEQQRCLRTSPAEKIA